MQAKTQLFNNSKPWVKKSGNKNLDVSMGCFDRVKVSETVGTHILSKISNEINKNQVGLYCDDGLGVLKSMSGSEIHQTEKSYQYISSMWSI